MAKHGQGGELPPHRRASSPKSPTAPLAPLLVFTGIYCSNSSMNTAITLWLRSLVLTSLACVTLSPSARADDSIKKLILPGEAFRVQERPAFILLPPEEK